MPGRHSKLMLTNNAKGSGNRMSTDYLDEWDDLKDSEDLSEFKISSV